MLRDGLSRRCKRCSRLFHLLNHGLGVLDGPSALLDQRITVAQSSHSDAGLSSLALGEHVCWEALARGKLSALPGHLELR